MATRAGYCPKCHRIKHLTKHHTCPKRFFGGKRNKTTLLLCRECHDEIERIIPYRRKLKWKEYLDLTGKWLQGHPVAVY